MRINNTGQRHIVSWVRLVVLLGLLVGTPVFADRDDIAYLRLTDDYWQVWVTDPVGKTHRQITTDAIDKTRVSWSPERDELLVNRNDGQLFRIHLTTGESQSIKLPVSGMLDAQWSPDGQWLAFSMISTTEVDTNNLWRIKLDGSELQKLNIQPELQLTPAWGPTARWMAYTAGTAIDRHEIWTLDMKDQTQTQITLDTRGFKFDPAYSPDAAIAFSAERDGNYDVWVIDKTNSKPRQLTTDPAFDGQPSWSPDGKQLVFSSLRDGAKRLWVMAQSGGDAIPITPENTKTRGPAWYR